MHPISKTASRRTMLIFCALVFVAAVAVYANSLGNGIVHDDKYIILKNPWILDISHLREIFTSSAWRFQHQLEPGEIYLSNDYRPLLHVLLMTARGLFGLDYWGYHLLSVLMHAFTSVLVFLLVARVMDEAKAFAGEGPFRRYAPPFVAALIFAVHPANTESVAWIAAYTELSFGLLYTLTFYLYISAQRVLSARFILAVVCYLATAIAKETGIVLPVLLFAYDIFIRKEPLMPVLPWVKRYLPLAAAGLAYFAIRMNALGGIAPFHPGTGDMASGIILNMVPLMGTYIYKLFFPVKLVYFEFLDPVKSALDARFILSALAVVGVIAAGAVSLRRKRVALFFIIWALVPMFPVFYASFVKGYPALAERYLYMPSVSLGAAAAICVACAFNSGMAAKYAAYAATIAALSLLSAATVQRNRVWENDLTLWTDTVSKTRGNKSAHNNLGMVYVNAGDMAAAKVQFEKALEADPSYHFARINLAGVYVKENMLDEALAQLLEAQKTPPATTAAAEGIEKNLKRIRRLKGLE